MLPLARAEVEGRTPIFLDHLFAGKLRNQAKVILGDDLARSSALASPAATRRGSVT